MTPQVELPSDNDDLEIDYDAIDRAVAAGQEGKLKTETITCEAAPEIVIPEDPTPRRRDLWAYEDRQKFPVYKPSLSLVKEYPNPGYCESGCGASGVGAKLDHCHETGNFRGYLCNRCNTSLGNLGDSLNNLENGIMAYLRRAQQRVREAIGNGITLEGEPMASSAESAEVLRTVMKAVEELSNLKASTTPGIRIDKFTPDMMRLILEAYYAPVPAARESISENVIRIVPEVSA